MSSNTTTSGACSSSSLRNAQRDLLRRGALIGLAEQRAERRRRRRIGRERAQLLHHLDHRPVGDPVPVGEAAAANNPRVDRAERLRHEPRLPDARSPTIVTSSQRLLRRAPAPRLGQQLELRSRPTNGMSCAARAPPAHASNRNAAPARACPSAPAARQPRHRPRHARARASPRRSRSRPVARPAAAAPPR